MKKLSYCGLVASIVVLAASCGRSIEFADTFGNSGGEGGAGGTSSSGSNNTSSGSESTGTSMVTTGTGTGSGSGTGTSSGTGTGTSTGTGSGSSSSSSGGMVCPAFGDPCTECLSTQCADIYCACYGNADCFGLSNCLNNCDGTEACDQGCYAAHPQGAAILYSLSNCGGENCSVDCPGTQPLDPCTTCLVETCDDEFNACLAFGPCIDLYQCLGGCGQVDLACQQGCYGAFGDGVSLLQKLLMCNSNNCPNCN